MMGVVLLLACVATQCEAGATQSAIAEVTAAGEELVDEILEGGRNWAGVHEDRAFDVMENAAGSVPAAPPYPGTEHGEEVGGWRWVIRIACAGACPAAAGRARGRGGAWVPRPASTSRRRELRALHY